MILKNTIFADIIFLNMIVFKFGGASVKDSDGIKNLRVILKKFSNQDIFVVISAMGKSTNAFEMVVKSILEKQQNWSGIVDEIFLFHNNIISSLNMGHHNIFKEVEEIKNSLISFIEHSKADITYDELYDSIVSYGELLSTKIISSYLEFSGVQNQWKDVRELICTDDDFRSATVDWSESNKWVKSFFETEKSQKVIITQGFVGATKCGKTTTLGREGSDFTAAILGNITNATSVTVWKDVPGLLNADPKIYDAAIKLDKISYREAVELAYFGAKVIHPKTIKPLENKNIPLYIRSFENIEQEGTTIHNQRNNDSLVTSYIFNQNQILISLATTDFSFIDEKQMYQIFGLLNKNSCKVNMMQNSAVSFSICIDNDLHKTKSLIDDFKKLFLVRYNFDLELITVRHFKGELPKDFLNSRKILLEQRSRSTIQMVVENRHDK